MTKNRVYKHIQGLFTNPKLDCIDFNIPDEREKDVFISEDRYLCVLIDDRFNNECRVQILKPYRYQGDHVMYGWTDGPNVYDHHDTPIHDDCERVVFWELYKDES